MDRRVRSPAGHQSPWRSARAFSGSRPCDLSLCRTGWQPTCRRACRNPQDSSPRKSARCEETHRTVSCPAAEPGLLARMPCAVSICLFTSKTSINSTSPVLVLHVDRPVSPIQAHGISAWELCPSAARRESFAFAHLPNSALPQPTRRQSPELAGHDLRRTPNCVVYVSCPVNPGHGPQPTATSSNCQEPPENRPRSRWCTSATSP